MDSAITETVLGDVMGNRMLIVGTYDTKDDELGYIAQVIHGQGGEVLTMDCLLYTSRCV